ncbi:MAG TPA: helix-turn-helix domain-containing protein [Euzebyales bacterium]|nr:helix-turn-helix domain-containing protein [Euzebyales bacterium]
MSRRDHLRISDACHVLGISRSTLLAAEEAGLITAGRTPGGHRRFAREELERYLATHGGSASSDDPVAHRPGAGPGRERVATDLRIALRELVQLVDATCAGVYLLDHDRLAYCAGFGIPRWQADRLLSTAPPDAVVSALGTSRLRMVDATGVVSRPRGGQAVTLPMLSDRTPLGVLFVVGRAGHELLPGELRIIAAAQRMLALLVDRLQRLADLERRLSGVRDLAASS